MTAPSVDNQRLMSPVSVLNLEEKNQAVVKDGRSYQVESSSNVKKIVEIIAMALAAVGFVVGGMLLTIASGGAAPVGILYAGIISMSVAAVCGAPFLWQAMVNPRNI